MTFPCRNTWVVAQAIAKLARSEKMPRLEPGPMETLEGEEVLRWTATIKTKSASAHTPEDALVALLTLLANQE